MPATRTLLTLTAAGLAAAGLAAHIQDRSNVRRTRQSAARRSLADTIELRSGLEVVSPGSLLLTAAPQRVLFAQDADLFWGTVVHDPRTGALHIDVPGITTRV